MRGATSSGVGLEACSGRPPPKDTRPHARGSAPSVMVAEVGVEVEKGAAPWSAGGVSGAWRLSEAAGGARRVGHGTVLPMAALALTGSSSGRGATTP